LISKKDSGFSVQDISVTVPVEIWTCVISVSHNPHAEAEAIVVEAMASAGSLEKWTKAYKGRAPFRTLSALVKSGALSVNQSGDVLPSEEVIESIREDKLVDLLRRSGGKRMEIRVVRDLLTGYFHPPDVMQDVASDTTGISIRPDAVVRHRQESDDLSKISVSNVIRPVSGRVGYSFGMSSADVLGGSTLLNVESREAEARVTYGWHKRMDGVVVPVVNGNNSLAQHILDKKTIPELGVVSKEREVKREWPPSPELEALAKLDIARKNIRRVQKGHAKVGDEYLHSLVKDALETTKSAISAIETEKSPRLDSVDAIVGTEFEQWNSVQAVISSAKERCVLLSAFTHEKFADEASERISDSLGEGCQILLLSGEPDRINEPGFAERTKAYGERLMKEGLGGGRFRLGVTKRASHAKFVISDTGMVWIGSCNLLSAAPSSWVLETGLLIEDKRVASEIINHVIEEGWLHEQDLDFVSRMISEAPNEAYNFEFKPTKKLRKRIKDLELGLQQGKESRSDNMRMIDYLMSDLREIAERPRWFIIKTEQHRPAMLDLIRQSRKRITIGSDGVRERGLDLSTIREISSRPADAENRASKFAVQIFWGRQDPSHVKKSDEEIKEAGARIKLLRQEVWKHDKGGKNAPRGALRAKFLPDRSLDPMLTHSKFISVDDERLLLTSDNLLSFSDDEGWESDARELGILIDSPRITRLMRGEMELLTPTCRDHWQRGRWHSAIASAVSECGGDRVPVDEVMESLSSRIRNSSQLTEDWFNMCENMNRTYNSEKSEVVFSLIREAEKDGLVFVHMPRSLKNYRWKNLSHDADRFKLIRLSLPHGSPGWRRRRAAG
jgi:phosphatidylserine/phosphatidylglycerophosphate/cardiolipin synthase-like enzyme